MALLIVRQIKKKPPIKCPSYIKTPSVLHVCSQHVLVLLYAGILEIPNENMKVNNLCGFYVCLCLLLTFLPVGQISSHRARRRVWGTLCLSLLFQLFSLKTWCCWTLETSSGRFSGVSWSLRLVSVHLHVCGKTFTICVCTFYFISWWFEKILKEPNNMTRLWCSHPVCR